MDLINFKKFTFLEGKYADNIDEWEEAHYEKLCFIFKKFTKYAKLFKICDEVDYNDFINLLFKYSIKSIYYDELRDENDLKNN